MSSDPLVSQLKVVLLDQAGAIQNLAVAYSCERQFLPGERTAAEGDAVVHQALLELVDEEAILFFRASWDEGWNADPEAVTPLTRDEVIVELERPADYVDPDDAVIFFTRTREG